MLVNTDPRRTQEAQAAHDSAWPSSNHRLTDELLCEIAAGAGHHARPVSRAQQESRYESDRPKWPVDTSALTGRNLTLPGRLLRPGRYHRLRNNYPTWFAGGALATVWSVRPAA